LKILASLAGSLDIEPCIAALFIKQFPSAVTRLIEKSNSKEIYL
jgi:hypothetical protein